jgi:hypothetical protein
MRAMNSPASSSAAQATPASPLPNPLIPMALLALAALLAGVLLLHGPIAQWASYHDFADQRAWLGLPNAADVLSNLPFALVGGAWLLATRTLRRTPATLAWRAFAIALIATAIGSAGYHWSPHNASLAFDRLPIAWACAALTCAFLAERVDARWARPGALAAALLLASLSVALWWWSEVIGRSDLRPYLFVQFLPMLLVPAALLMRLPRRFDGAAPDRAWWGVLAGYGIAKALEVADHAVLEHLAFLSGHTLKHVAAAGAAGWLLHGAWCAVRTDQLR